MAEGKRKLAAILSADVVGYSRLMADDEAATVVTLKEYRASIERVITRHGGRVVNAPGDNILAEFPSAVEGVHAAVEIQQSVRGHNVELAPDRRMEFRVGVNLGDVIEEDDGTIYGDGVNIAARMEALADTGGICIASSIYDAVLGKLEFGFEFLGEQQVKNIDRPINVYRVRSEQAKAPGATRRPWSVPAIWIAAVVLIIAVIAPLVWWQSMSPTENGETEQQGGDPIDPVLALPSGPKIAVLPFENLSGDEAQGYFSDGLTEDIIMRLSRFSMLFVIARSSTGHYRGQTVDAAQVRQDLGADYVVAGSVRTSGNTIRVAVQLIDAADQTPVWSETYDRDYTVTDLFEIQDDITERVAGTIAGGTGIILRTQAEAIKDKPTDSLVAYECVLRTVNYYDGISPDLHREVRDCLERAVELDPGYADAWALLASAYTDEVRFVFNPIEGSLDRALDAGLRSVELDADGDFGRQNLAQVYFHRNELDLFFAEAERAIAQNPNNGEMLAALGDKMFWAGETERGYALVTKAVALNPRHPGWYNFALSGHHYQNGDYERALEFALQINMPDFFWNHAFLASTYGQLGRDAEARRSADRLLELYPDFVQDFYELADAFNMPENVIIPIVEGYRKAGLVIPERPALTN